MLVWHGSSALNSPRAHSRSCSKPAPLSPGAMATMLNVWPDPRPLKGVSSSPTRATAPPSWKIGQDVRGDDYPTLSGPGSRSWLLSEKVDAEICEQYPGGEEQLVVVVNDPVAFARWHLGELTWGEALRSRAIEVTGSRALARALPTWHRDHERGPQPLHAAIEATQRA